MEDPGIHGRIILKRIFKKWDGGMGWLDLDQDKGRWRAVVKAVMNLRVPKIQGISRLAEHLSAFQEGLCSMKLVMYRY